MLSWYLSELMARERHRELLEEAGRDRATREAQVRPGVETRHPHHVAGGADGHAHHCASEGVGTPHVSAG